MPNENAALNAAARAKKDEFYTQIEDIEKELRWYRHHFAGKTVLCNCDDPFESDFFRWFVLNFDLLALKKSIATSYASGARGRATKAYRAIVTSVREAEGHSADALDMAELFRRPGNELLELAGDGDFRSPECLALLDEADVVVTNPPFSLFRKYVATLMERDKKFIIIGNVNAITYKEIFPLIMDGQMWLGPSIHSGDRAFWVPDDYPLDASGCGVDPKTGRRSIRVKGVRWFTNLDHGRRHEPMILVARYSPDAYPKYDNYDAIEVSRTKDIPCDYPGIMGVPITFLDKYCPEQFEILGITDRQDTSRLRTKKYTVADSPRYNDMNARSVLKTDEGYRQVYARILIRNRRPTT